MQIIMPKLGLTTTHGTITEWLKAPGDAVKAEETLCTYETEKVTLELPSPADGILAEILVPAGETVAVGTPLCVVETAGERQRSTVGRQAAQREGPIVATPKARALARQLGVDLGRVRGSGPAGRIQAADVAAAGAPAEEGVQRPAPPPKKGCTGSGKKSPERSARSGRPRSPAASPRPRAST